MPAPSHQPLFHRTLSSFVWLYLVLIAALVAANAWYAISEVSPDEARSTFSDPSIRRSFWLTLATSTVSAFLALLTAVPVGYALARFGWKGRRFLESIFDIPIALPPLVVGFSLLLLFNHFPVFGDTLDGWFGGRVTYAVPAILLAQYTVGTAFAIRAMADAFREIDSREEQVAQTLGCSQMGAFFRVAIPEARSAMVAAYTLAWARCVGEFGPILVFAGAIRGKTEVLATSIYLEIGAGRLESAVLVSLLLITIAVSTLFVLRVCSKE